MGISSLTGPPAMPALTVFLGLDAEGAPWFACKTKPDRGPPRPAQPRHGEACCPPRNSASWPRPARSSSGMSAADFCSNCGGRNRDGRRRLPPPLRLPAAWIIFRAPTPSSSWWCAMRARILLGRQSGLEARHVFGAGGLRGTRRDDRGRGPARSASRRRASGSAQSAMSTSQPWPFLVKPDDRPDRRGADGPRSALDEKELEDARWFDREEARMMLERTHPEGLYAANPYGDRA